MGEFRLPSQSRYLRSSAILRSVQWQFLTDVSEQPSGPILKGQESILLNSNWKGWAIRDKMYKTGLGHIWLGREGKVSRAICQIMQPKCDNEQRHTSVETTRFLSWDWELGKWEVSGEVHKKEDAPCATDKSSWRSWIRASWYNYESNKQDATIQVNLLFLVSCTCFGRCFRPSSEELDCIYSIW
jgi:hypothetical protein